MREGVLPLVDPLRASGQALVGNLNNVALYPDNLLYLVAPPMWALNAHLWLHLLLAPVALYLLARALGLAPRGVVGGRVLLRALRVLPLAAQPLQPDCGHGARAGVRRRLRRIDLGAPARARRGRRRDAVAAWCCSPATRSWPRSLSCSGSPPPARQARLRSSPPAATRFRSLLRRVARRAADRRARFASCPARIAAVSASGSSRGWSPAGIRARRSTCWCRSSSGRPISATGARSCCARSLPLYFSLYPGLFAIALGGRRRPPALAAGAMGLVDGSARRLPRAGRLEPVHVLSLSAAAGGRACATRSRPGSWSRSAPRCWPGWVSSGRSSRARGAACCALSPSWAAGATAACVALTLWYRPVVAALAARITPSAPSRAGERGGLSLARRAPAVAARAGDRRRAGDGRAPRAAARRLLAARAPRRHTALSAAPDDRHRRHRLLSRPRLRPSPSSIPAERIAHGCPISLGCELGGPGTYPDWRMSWFQRRAWLELYPFVAAQFGLRNAYDVSPEGLDTVLVFAGQRALREQNDAEALRLLAAASVDVVVHGPPGGQLGAGPGAAARSRAVDRRRSLDLRDRATARPRRGWPAGCAAVRRGGSCSRCWRPISIPLATRSCLDDPPASEERGGGTATIESESRERLRIRTASATAGLLVLGRAWLPHYRARVDGAAAEPIQANFGQLALELPAGAAHRRDLGRPPAFRGSARRQRAGSARSLRARGVGGAAVDGASRPPLVSLTTVLKNRPVSRSGTPARDRDNHQETAQGAGRQPRRDRGARDPRPARPRYPRRRRALDRRSRRAAGPARRRGLPHRRRAGGERELSQGRRHRRAGAAHRRRRRPSRLRIPLRERRVRAPLPRRRHRLHRPHPRGDRGDGLQDREPPAGDRAGRAGGSRRRSAAARSRRAPSAPPRRWATR